MKIMKEKKGIAKLFLLVLVFFLGMFFVEGNNLDELCGNYHPLYNRGIGNYVLPKELINEGNEYNVEGSRNNRMFVRFDPSVGTWEYTLGDRWVDIKHGQIGNTRLRHLERAVREDLARQVKGLKQLKDFCSSYIPPADEEEVVEEEESIDGECGPAKGVYGHNDNNFRVPFCDKGNLIGDTPQFPAPGNSVIWTCEGTGDGNNKECLASRKTIPEITNLVNPTDNDNGDNGGQNGVQPRECVGTKPTGNGYDFGVETHTDEGEKSWKYVVGNPGPCEYTCEDDYVWDGENCVEEAEGILKCNDADLDDEDECICHISGPFENSKVENKNFCLRYCDNCYEGTNCYCPDDCENAMWILNKEVETCGGVDLFSCTSLGGECMTEDNCEKKYEDDFDESIHIINDAEDCDFVCCKIGDGNQRSLRDCSTFCSVAAGCKCNKNCQTRTSFNGSKIIYTPGEDYEVIPGFNCLGYHRTDPFRLAECNNEQRDGICPAHCFWWNDLDCGIQANIIDVLWDYTGLADWWAETSYVQKVQEFANYLTFDYWAESICNPLVKMRQRVQPITDGYFTHYDTHGWISGIMDLYNETHYVYTMSYYLSNLREDNNYRIEYRGDNTFKYPFEEADNVYKIDNNYWFNVTANSVVQNTSITFTDEKEYLTICMIFKNEMDLGGYEIKEVCRGINVEW